MSLWCCWCLSEKIKERIFLVISWFFSRTSLSFIQCHFTSVMKTEKVFLNSWLSILTHFAKRYIDLNASLSSCICDLKCTRFACWMILFLWLLCFKYSFHASNVLCVFHIIHSHLDFITIFEQFEFQKFLAQLNDFVKKVNFSMISCNILITLHILLFIIVLLFKERFNERCICKYILNASVFIFFHNHWVENCTEVVYRQSSVTIERWFNS